MNRLLKNTWQEAMSFDQYIDLMNQLVLDKKSTGSNQSEAMIFYTKMAAQRMRKWEKLVEVDAEIFPLDKIKAQKMGWLIITESWCGDAGQSIVPLKKIANVIGVEIKLILRDENTDLIDQFLTNGGRSIPKLIAVNLENYSPIWDWGPRPKALQKWYLNEKAKSNFDYSEASKAMHLWYAQNKHADLLKEIIEKLSIK